MSDEQQIVPGQGIGRFRVGEPGEPQIAWLAGERAVEVRGTLQVVQSEEVSLFLEEGVLTQVGIHAGHPGRTSDGLRLGLTLGEVAGTLLFDPHNEVLLLEGVEGLCFSTDQSLEQAAEAGMDGATSVKMSRGDRIEWIGVHLAEFDSPVVLAVELQESAISPDCE